MWIQHSSDEKLMMGATIHFALRDIGEAGNVAAGIHKSGRSSDTYAGQTASVSRQIVLSGDPRKLIVVSMSA